LYDELNQILLQVSQCQAVWCKFPAKLLSS
jgi:hypothetical protein